MIEKREVTPQWAGEKAGNLGTHTVNTVAFTKDSLTEALAKYPEFVVNKFNGMCSINILGPEFVRRVTSGLPEREEGEKLDAWKDRVRKDAVELAVSVAEMEFDFPALLAEAATKPQGKAAKKVLDNYDGNLAFIAANWDTLPTAKQDAILARLAITPESRTAEGVCNAIKANYKPAVVVSMDDMFTA